MSWRSSVAAVAVLSMASAAVIVAGNGRPSLAEPHSLALRLPITSAMLSCPVPPGAAGSTSSVFAVGPNAEGTDGSLEVDATTSAETLRVGSTQVSGVPVRSRLTETDGEPSVLVSARRGLAAGATAALISRYAGSTTTGLAASWCLTPGGEWWFSGVDTSVGTTTALVLSNPGPGPAVVDLQILGPRGVIDAAGANGIALAPRSRQVLDLAAYAPGRPALTLHVTATRGTVAAAVSTLRLDGLTPAGAEWVAPSANPAASVVIDAGVADADTQDLVVTNPGPRQELVSVRILDQSGAFTPTGLPDIQVPPGSVVVHDITSITLRHAAAVELTASGPVTGAIVSELAGETRDFAVSTDSAALSAPAVVPTMAGATLSLAFSSATPGVEDVRIRSMNRDGDQVGESRVTVTGATTTSWTLPDESGAAWLIVKVPRGSRLSAVATYAGADGIAQLPMLSGRWTVVHPSVIP